MLRRKDQNGQADMQMVLLPFWKVFWVVAAAVAAVMLMMGFTSETREIALVRDFNARTTIWSKPLQVFTALLLLLVACCCYSGKVWHEPSMLQVPDDLRLISTAMLSCPDQPQALSPVHQLLCLLLELVPASWNHPQSILHELHATDSIYTLQPPQLLDRGIQCQPHKILWLIGFCYIQQQRTRSHSPDKAKLATLELA